MAADRVVPTREQVLEISRNNTAGERDLLKRLFPTDFVSLWTAEEVGEAVAYDQGVLMVRADLLTHLEEVCPRMTIKGERVCAGWGFIRGITAWREHKKMPKGWTGMSIQPFEAGSIMQHITKVATGGLI